MFCSPAAGLRRRALKVGPESEMARHDVFKGGLDRVRGRPILGDVKFLSLFSLVERTPHSRGSVAPVAFGGLDNVTAGIPSAIGAFCGRHVVGGNIDFLGERLPAKRPLNF